MRRQTGRLESRWTAINGLPIHYRVSIDPVLPERLPVILVHGQVASSRYMVPIAEHLAPDFQVYAPDLPGFGKSGKPPHTLNIIELADALAAWMAQLGLDRAHLIGNSLGCNILVEFALHHGERIECLVLQGPPTDPTARTVFQQVGRWLRNSQREPSMGSILIKDYAAAGLWRAVQTFRYLLQHRIEARLPAVQAPTLVVRGTRDPIVPLAWTCQAADLLSQGRLIEIPGAAHTIDYFAPRQFARVLRVFFGLSPLTTKAPELNLDHA